MLYRVLLKKKNQGIIFMLAFLAVSDLYYAFFSDSIYIVWSQSILQLLDQTLKREEGTKVQIINGIIG